MDRLEAPDREGLGLEGVSLRAPRLRPETVLRRAGGAVRGFWARGDRWVAHAGTVAEVVVDPGEGAERRFQRVREGAAAVLQAARETGARTAPSAIAPRMYGGFAFRDEPRQGELWADFPPARFVLPALEAVGDGEGAWVTLRARPPADADGEWGDLRGRLEERLARWSREARSDGDPHRVGARIRESDRGRWEAAVEQAKGEIERGRVRKVVLARTLDVEVDEPLDPVDVVLGLWRENPGTHVFLFEPSPGEALVGAAPETVATVSDGIFRATAVAGSIARGPSPERQEALALKLLESGKDRMEHAIAVEDMVARLAPIADELDWDSEPHVLTLSRIQHLETRIRAALGSEGHVLSALEALHPTPAVCGLPRDAALDFLRVEEPFQRGWYAGPVGWFDLKGNGVFAPALRSAVSGPGRWRLFAGAGIVPESDPVLEWEETRIKFLPALRALEGAGAEGAVAALETRWNSSPVGEGGPGPGGSG